MQINEESSEPNPFSYDFIFDPYYEADSTTTVSEQEAPLHYNEEEVNAIKKTRKMKDEWYRNKTKLLRNSRKAYVILNKHRPVVSR